MNQIKCPPCNHNCDQSDTCPARKPSAQLTYIYVRKVVIMITTLVFLLLCVVNEAKAEEVLVQEVSLIEEVATSTTTFAVCKTADVLSTAYVISHGIGVEANPIIAATLSHGFGPLIIISALLYWALVELNNKPATLAANAVTCGVAVNNLMLIF